MATCPDVAPECASMEIPPHEHRVRVGLAHYELSADYGLRDGIQLSIRVPFDSKAMRVRYTSPDGSPYIPPYGDIHHRTETLTGLGDATIALDYELTPHVIAGGGLSLPIGRIERDPVEAGRRGEEHQHMQFGSGTVLPRLHLQWRYAPWVARVETRLSLYENREGFRAPHLVLWSAGRSFRVGRVSLDPRLAGQYQSLGRWNGEVDEGTGFHNGGVRLQASVPVGGFVIAPGVYRELWSRSLHHEESFRQRWTYSVMFARTF